MVTEVTDATDRSPAQLVKEARKRLGLTQAEFGALFDGRTKRTVIRWERGTTSVPPDALAQIASRVRETEPTLAALLGAVAPAVAPTGGRTTAPAAQPTTAAVIAAVQKLSAAPASARSLLHAAVVRAEAVGATLKSLRLALEHVDPLLGLG